MLIMAGENIIIPLAGENMMAKHSANSLFILQYVREKQLWMSRSKALRADVAWEDVVPWARCTEPQRTDDEE